MRFFVSMLPSLLFLWAFELMCLTHKCKNTTSFWSKLRTSRVPLNAALLDLEANEPIETSYLNAMKLHTVVPIEILSQSIIHLSSMSMIGWVLTSSRSIRVSPSHSVSISSFWSTAENEVRTLSPCNFCSHAYK